MAKLVMTAVGPDRPGLVSALSDAVASAGGNWLESRLARLAGTFAGIVLLEVPESALDALAAATRQLGDSGVLQVTLTPSQAEPEPTGTTVHLFVVGHDRPGIVRTVSAALAALGVTIEGLTTELRDAPMGAGTLFEADADLRLPRQVSLGEVREALESIAHDLVVDLDIPEPHAE